MDFCRAAYCTLDIHSVKSHSIGHSSIYLFFQEVAGGTTHPKVQFKIQCFPLVLLCSRTCPLDIFKTERKTNKKRLYCSTNKQDLGGGQIKAPNWLLKIEALHWSEQMKQKQSTLVLRPGPHCTKLGQRMKLGYIGRPR